MKHLLLQILLCCTIFILAEIDSNESTIDCIAQAVHLIAKRKIAVQFTEESQDIASKILGKVNIPAVLNTREHRKQTGIEHRTSIDVLLLLKDTEPVNILNDTLWNGDTRFIIITDDEEVVEDYFEQFWKLKVINVFGMVMNEHNNTVYSFLPYGKKNCTKAEPIIVDTCVDGKLQNGGTAFTDSMRIKNMNRCPINVTITHVRPSLIFEPKEGWKNSSTAKGFEGNGMQEVAKLYNFSPTFKIAEDGLGWGWVRPHPMGAVGDLYRGITDMIIGMPGPFVERYEFLDFAANYNLDECVSFLVPRGYGAKQAYWLSIFVLEFTYHTWILILFSFVLIAVNIWLINKYLNINWLETKSKIVIFLFSSLLGMPVKTPRFISARISVLFWTTCTFILMVSYKASIGSKLTVPLHDPDINTFEELLQSDLEIMGIKNMIQLLKISRWPYTELKNRYKNTTEGIDTMVVRAANREKVAYLYPKASIMYYSLVNRKTRGRIHVVKDCVYTYHPYPMLQKFSPFTRRVGQTVRRLEESGIMEMWRAEYVKKIPPPKKPFFKLSLEQMLGVFCFLLIGYIVAVIAFIGEVVVVYGFWESLCVSVQNLWKGYR